MAVKSTSHTRSPRVDHKGKAGGEASRGPIRTTAQVAKTKEGRNNSPENGKFNTTPNTNKF